MALGESREGFTHHEQCRSAHTHSVSYPHYDLKMEI